MKVGIMITKTTSMNNKFYKAESRKNSRWRVCYQQATLSSFIIQLIKKITMGYYKLQSNVEI